MQTKRLIVCRLVLLAGFVLCLVNLAAAQLSQAPATIYLIRHAEKLTDGQMDLSPQGYKRAALLPALFMAPSGERTLPALPAPQLIFATHKSDHSNRPLETVTPLAAALHLEVNNVFHNEDYAGLAKELLGGSYAGKIVLVSWHHGKLPALATALGAKPPYIPWPDTQFDRIWCIRYANGTATLTDLPQELLSGDSK
jgi:hypothetical protein